ncbi:MAG: hypothetical protein A2104_09015 [Candidatus Melainabacteria bacterium GWF2_32_7]|nr:MAG: hypothetical protein A2104_09015 [Candidatus Melainabacteria bacterium GWF2_32_7]OGI20330.1 MAG: hypothetical protein A2255_10490 [Candidatus Melainabacteria bacterium RIFOXYA2_FULL_32_9]
MSQRMLMTIDDLDKTLIDFVIQEKTNTEMAEKTGYSVGYVKRRLAYLFRLFGVKSKVGLVREIYKFNSY